MKFATPYDIVFHPIVTEKTMAHMTTGNSLEFLVRREASKTDVKKAVETLFASKVTGVRTRNSKDGKRAIVTFKEPGAAEEVGMRIGVF